MSLEILKVENSNDVDKEYVRLQSDIDENLRGYALVDKTFSNKGEASNEFRHIFIFPSIDVKAGDFVRVYTGEGNYRKEKTAKGHRHYLYWNSDQCVWNDKLPDEAILIKFAVKSRKKVNE